MFVNKIQNFISNFEIKIRVKNQKLSSFGILYYLIFQLAFYLAKYPPSTGITVPVT